MSASPLGLGAAAVLSESFLQFSDSLILARTAENTAQNTDPNPNSGFYRVTLDFNDISWAFANNLTTVSSFASNVVLVPEPSGAALCLMAPFAFLCRRARSQPRRGA